MLLQNSMNVQKGLLMNNIIIQYHQNLQKNIKDANYDTKVADIENKVPNTTKLVKQIIEQKLLTLIQN